MKIDQILISRMELTVTFFLLKLLKEREKGAFALEKWKQHELNPKTMDEKAVDW
jgi:hypothetical protein